MGIKNAEFCSELKTKNNEKLQISLTCSAFFQNELTFLNSAFFVLSDPYPAFFLLIATTSNKIFLKVQKL